MEVKTKNLTNLYCIYKFCFFSRWNYTAHPFLLLLPSHLPLLFLLLFWHISISNTSTCFFLFLKFCRLLGCCFSPYTILSLFLYFFTITPSLGIWRIYFSTNFALIFLTSASCFSCFYLIFSSLHLLHSIFLCISHCL